MNAAGTVEQQQRRQVAAGEFQKQHRRNKEPYDSL
jgi:hypothetical protein